MNLDLPHPITTNMVTHFEAYPCPSGASASIVFDNRFGFGWMSGDMEISQCVDAATEPMDELWPFDCPLGLHWQIFGDPNLTRDPDQEP
jgi:hypothetical protein